MRRNMFYESKCTAWAQYAPYFGQNLVRIGNGAQDQRRNDLVDRIIGKRNVLA